MPPMEVGGGPWTVTGGSLRQLVSCTDRIGDFRCRMQENGGGREGKGMGAEILRELHSLGMTYRKCHSERSEESPVSMGEILRASHSE